MIGFCGAVDFEGRRVDFSMLKKMCGLHNAGCAYINKEFGILCDGLPRDASECLQPYTVCRNGSLYTAAIVASDSDMGGMIGAQELAEGYAECGDDFIKRLSFPYALALFDGHCGELTLAKSELGDKALFYTHKRGVLYFSSALRPLIRLYGGCVRISKARLREHLLGDLRTLTEGLFCDIYSLRGGEALVCSSFGECRIPVSAVECSFGKKQSHTYVCMPKKFSEDIRTALGEALFAFDYPQFDALMPQLAELLHEYRSRGEKSVYAYDGIADINMAYASERAERMGGIWGMNVYTAASAPDSIQKRTLRRMEKQLDAILQECFCRSSKIFEQLGITRVDADAPSDILLRIRRKGMLCQTAMWFDSFNLVLV